MAQNVPQLPTKLIWSASILLALGGFTWLILLLYYQDDITQATNCSGHFTTIAVAMDQYHQWYGHFPPAYRTDASGKPAHSWRVLLLEFLDHELYAKYRFDEPWDGPNNRKLESRMPSYYACPADREGKAR